MMSSSTGWSIEKSRLTKAYSGRGTGLLHFLQITWSSYRHQIHPLVFTKSASGKYEKLKHKLWIGSLRIFYLLPWCLVVFQLLLFVNKLRNSASSFHWLSSSIFSVCLFVRPASVTPPLISTIWCFRPYKPYIFCEDMILATCQCHSLLSWA